MTWNLPRLAGVALAVLGVPVAASAAPACAAASPARTVALLELYTSEGCNSCPPADRWLGALQAVPALAGRVVPLALHVDYWDYLGWADPYARPGFAARQRGLARSGGAAVYTPQFFLQGRPYRPPATAAAFAADLDALGARLPGADLSLGIAPAAGGRLAASVAVRLPRPRPGLVLFVALYENGLASRVAAGENRGAELHHDFVVRAWDGPRALTAAGGEEMVAFPLAPDWQAGRLGIAAFVQDPESGEVLQALALPACGSTSPPG